MDRHTLLDHLIGPVIVLCGFVVALELRRGARRRREAAARRGEASPQPWPWRRGYVGSITLAALYLLLFRGISFLPNYSMDGKGAVILMSFSFLFLGPFVAGFITVDQAAEKEPLPVKQWFIAPWIPILLNVALAVAIAWEGIICAVFIVPPAMVSASLGGVLAGLNHRYTHRRRSKATVACIAALPVLLCVVETHIQQPREVREMQTAIFIHAPASIVWQNIERVPAISRSELRGSWANTIGFPRPVEATLSHEGVGGVRNASFERGLTFTETVTDWEPLQRLAFTIRANTESIPPTTLDEHVTVGGRFFDVLTGEYRLESLPNGDTLLHLSSRERLSTDFNAYAALWSDAVMRDMQDNILHVIQQRCERQIHGVATLSLTPTDTTSHAVTSR